MSKRNTSRSPALSEAGRRRALRSWGTYLLTLMAWVTVVILLIVLCALLPWYSTPFGSMATWIRDNIVLCAMAVVLAGWVAISYFFIARPTEQLEELTAAAAQLARPTEEPISLPVALSDVESQLNAAREQALRDARAARDAEQRKNDLVVYLAHDLKTPLTSVIGYLTLLRDEPQLSPELRGRYTGIALEKAERLEDLINEFFDITRFNLSHIELEKETVDLTRMIQQVVSEFQPMLAEKNLRCAVELPPQLPFLCDGEKLSRVFDNLLRNACYYSFPDSTVRISGRTDGGFVVLRFTNAGKTIPPEKLSRLFEQFFRLDSSRATHTGGAGLGLAIAKEIVELHGGTIRAESADSSITFTLRLPLRP